MGMHHYKAKFRAIAEKKERKSSTQANLKFQQPIWSEVVLFSIEKIEVREIKEERAGVYFEPLSLKKRKRPIIVIQTSDDIRVEFSGVRDLICFPNFGQESSSARHKHETEFWRTDAHRVIWEGEAYFSYFVPDPPKPDVKENDLTIVEKESDSVELNDDDWLEINSEDSRVSSNGINSIFKRGRNLGKLANRRLPIGLLILGLILLFVNPLIGFIVLGIAFYSLSRSKPNTSSQIGNSADVKTDSTAGESSASNSKRSGAPVSSQLNKPINVFGGRRLRWMTLFWIALAILFLIKLWSLGSLLFWPLALATMIYFIASRNASWGWLLISRILFWFLLLLSALFLLGTYVDTSDYLPEERGEGDSRTERVKREGTDIISSRHTITWQNPLAEGTNEVTYYTGDNPYQASLKAHESIRNISQNTSARNYWSQVYTKLLVEDNQKIDSLTTLVSKTSKERSYSALETAEYLVSLIQEIPYVLVHDQSCQEIVNQSGGFVRDYHVQRKPCLPNVIAGVQSPYEFMHTLEGDCDTRSLLGHAVLRKLGISSSVWISEQYGHSILGVGVPSSSRAKKVVNGIPHYGVELTAKGFRVGMISPDQINMRNWEVAVFKNF